MRHPDPEERKSYSTTLSPPSAVVVLSQPYEMFLFSRPARRELGQVGNDLGSLKASDV
jgi:hypothetical protein